MNTKDIRSTCYIGDDHKYFKADTNEQLNVRSVTDLINMIYPFNVSEIPPEILKAAQVRGTCVHERLESYIKTGDAGVCPHGIKKHEILFDRAKDVVDKLDYDEIYSEISLYNDVYCGTFDLLLVKDNKLKMFDFKTSSKTHREKEMLQMNLYSKLLKDNFGFDVNRFGVINPNVEMYYLFDQEEEKLAEQNYEKIMLKLNVELN